MVHYLYSKKAFTSLVEIQKEHSSFGKIRSSFWDSECSLVFGDNKYIFRKKSIWSRNYLIYNIDYEIIGEIAFTFFKQKIQISLIDFESFIMYPTDFWHYKYQIQNEKAERIIIKKTKIIGNQEGSVISEIRNQEKSDLLVGISIFILFVKMRRTSKDGSY